MTTRGELSAAAWEHCERKCPHACRQSKRSGDCEHLLARRRGMERDIDRLELLLDLRDLLAEAMLTRALVADMLRDEGWRSPPLSDEEIERRMAKRRAERAGAK